MITWDLIQKIELQVLAIALVLLIILSIVPRLVRLPKKWEIPVILLSLLSIILTLSTLLYRIDDTLGNVDSEVENVHSKVELLLQKVGGPLVDRYDTRPEFYTSLMHAVDSAENSLVLTHIRDLPPDTTIPEEKKYFETVKYWCETHPGGSVRRMIAVNNPKMLKWAESLLEFHNEHRNFYVKVCEWKASFPMVNMAIVDEKKVFLAVTGSIAHDTPGLQIQDPMIVRLFSNYYSNAWGKSKNLTVALVDSLRDNMLKTK